MAGGPTTVDLVVAVSHAGAFGFLAGGYKTAEVLSKEMAGVRAAGVARFGVNLFLPGQPTTDSEGLAAYLRVLGAEAAALGTTLGDPAWDDDDYPRKLDLLLADPPAVVSFTFGVPAP
jgi:nitronate monooxygenase